MYKVTLSVRYLELGFAFEDIQQAAIFMEDVLKHYDREDKMTVTIRLHEEREVTNDESVSD